MSVAFLREETCNCLRNPVSGVYHRPSELGEPVPHYSLPLLAAAPFSGNSPIGQTRLQIFASDGSNDDDSRKGMPFGVSLIFRPFRGSSRPKSPNLWGVKRRFQDKRAKNSNFHIFETTTSIAAKFCTVIKTTNYLRGWSKYTPKQIQDGDGRHLEKLKNHAISKTL